MKKIIKEKTSKRVLINLKIYFDRARMYLGYINFFMLNLVFFNSSDGGFVYDLIQNNKYLIIPILFILYLVVLMFIGYLDTRWGLREEEMRNNSMTNPILRELVENVREIKEHTKRQESV